jgi:hypothetical protein
MLTKQQAPEPLQEFWLIKLDNGTWGPNYFCKSTGGCPSRNNKAETYREERPFGQENPGEAPDRVLKVRP